MASHRPVLRARGPAAQARDAALRRLSKLNRLAAAGSVALALGFTALAAHATPPRQHPTTGRASASSLARASSTSSASSSASTAASAAAARTATPTPVPAANPPPTSAPAPSPQPPVAVSGGS